MGTSKLIAGAVAFVVLVGALAASALRWLPFSGDSVAVVIAAMAAGAGTLAAGATMVAAQAARDSAETSKTIAAETNEALIRTFRPDLSLWAWADAEGNAEVQVALNSTNRLPARDVQIAVSVPGGQDLEGHAARLHGEGEVADAVLTIVRGDKNAELAGPGICNSAVLKYWDDRRLAQWEQTFSVVPSRRVGESTIQEGYWTGAGAHRIQ